MATRRRTRAAGSGALAKFRAERRRVLRREWRDWTIMCLITVSFLGAVIETHGFVQLLSAAVFGFSIAVLLFGWFVGGNVHSLPWMWGAVGEQQTAAVLDQLGHEWVCVHAVPRKRGDWDHVVLGPAGVFVLDSKNLSRPARVVEDALLSGRLRVEGRWTRRAAIELKERIAELGVRPPFVHAVVVVWGEFDQRCREERDVTYVHGSSLLEWLNTRPPTLNKERLRALRDALNDLDASAPIAPVGDGVRLQPRAP